MQGPATHHTSPWCLNGPRQDWANDGTQFQPHSSLGSSGTAQGFLEHLEDWSRVEGGGVLFFSSGVLLVMCCVDGQASNLPSQALPAYCMDNGCRCHPIAAAWCVAQQNRLTFGVLGAVSVSFERTTLSEHLSPPFSAPSFMHLCDSSQDVHDIRHHFRVWKGGNLCSLLPRTVAYVSETTVLVAAGTALLRATTGTTSHLGLASSSQTIQSTKFFPWR